MKTRKIPMRTCIVSKEKLPKQELIRIVKNNDNIVSVDLTGKANGHGAYIKKDIETVQNSLHSYLIPPYYSGYASLFQNDFLYFTFLLSPSFEVRIFYNFIILL